MKSERLLSVDAFRGLTIATMIVVNNPGSWKYVYAPLRHAQWHGWTLTDLVFPFFLFIVGISIALALSRRRQQGIEQRALYLKIGKRALIIFSLGIILHLVSRFNFATLRIPGVLQRIALCYFFSALIYIHVQAKGRGAISVAILAAYWLLLKLVPVPGYGAGILEYKGNLCGYIDTQLLAGHLYRPEFDPEGILSTLPAIATTLLGTLAGDWLRTKRKVSSKTIGIFVAGILLTLLGFLLHPLFPINKQLWTSTYVIFTAGAALLVLGVLVALMDGLDLKKWSYPFLVLGSNAITVFVGSALLTELISLIKISEKGQAVGLIAYFYDHLLSPLAGPFLGSLLYPLLLLIFWAAVMVPLYKNRIFIRI